MCCLYIICVFELVSFLDWETDDDKEDGSENDEEDDGDDDNDDEEEEDEEEDDEEGENEEGKMADVAEKGVKGEAAGSTTENAVKADPLLVDSDSGEDGDDRCAVCLNR